MGCPEWRAGDKGAGGPPPGSGGCTASAVVRWRFRAAPQALSVQLHAESAVSTVRIVWPYHCCPAPSAGDVLFYPDCIIRILIAVQ